uniref:Uncharacterized protein n=1 Tax=Pinguiococcus pyrenoidosus TaxID=172671 RepID=A0A7R9YEN4_9STRA|mmetsp:Transcript_4884/g.19555  ORF Transcript_4884/g.19555 Transcript_4884/m.19555 type:complete len:110 (+) Transcript_4884:170-499(+)
MTTTTTATIGSTATESVAEPMRSSADSLWLEDTPAGRLARRMEREAQKRAEDSEKRLKDFHRKTIARVRRRKARTAAKHRVQEASQERVANAMARIAEHAKWYRWQYAI